MPVSERVLRTLAAQELHLDRLLALPNVVGVGTGYRERGGKQTSEVVVQTFVQRKYPDDQLPPWARVPPDVTDEEGARVRTDVIDVGFVYAAQDTTRYRPVPGGCSIGHQNLMDASTLGGWACDLTDRTTVILTCNHCIANLNAASVPGGIVQPGRLDGGVAPGDLIGQLKRFAPITVGVTPLPVSPVDAAIGTITVARQDQVLGTGPAIYETRAPALGMNVQKRGRTTLFTNNGRITSINVSVTVNYGGGRFGLIGNSFIVTSTNTNAFANRGDSGSLIFDQAAGTLNGTRPVVGMFFAVSNGGITTWHNNIGAVFAQLNLTTICDCAIRALLDAIGGTRRGLEARGASLSRKERQLRALRDSILPETPFGRSLGKVLEAETATILSAISQDEEAFGLAVRTFAPLVEQRTNADLLDAELDAATVASFGHLADRLGKVEPKLRPQFAAMKASIRAVEGSTVRELLATGQLRQPTRRKKRK